MLGKAGRRQVLTAQDGQEVIDNVLYVAPVDHHLLAIDGFVRLGRGPRENLSRPAIDLLFRSVGACYGGGAIGVLLSGMLNDGAAGLADLKRCGGVALVQNPADSIAPDMPIGALEASDVDHRGPAAGIAPILAQLLSADPGPDLPASDAILLEIDIALGRPRLTEHIETIADAVPLSCPSCGGVLSRLRTKPLRSSCQVGHAFSAEVLLREQEGSLDEAIRVACVLSRNAPSWWIAFPETQPWQAVPIVSGISSARRRNCASMPKFSGVQHCAKATDAALRMAAGP